jgi:capsular exopolysaccharide synthesis family protein
VKAALIVNELAHSYMQLYATTDSQVSQKVIEYVMELANEQLAEYKRLRGDVEALTEQTAGQGFPAKQDAKPTKDPIQQQLELELLDAEIELLMIEAELRAEKAVFGREDFTPPEDLVAIRLAADPELAQRKAALTIKKEKRDEHKKVTKNPDQDNALKQREQVIAADEQRIQELTAERRKEIESELSKTARIKREAQIAKLEFDHDKLLHKCEYLKSRLQTNRSEQKSTAGKTLDLELASSDMESARERYDALTIKVQQLKADQRAPERVRPFQSATVPTRPDEEIPLKKMIMAALAAMLLPFGLAVGIEVLFGRVANRKQLESASRVSVVGEITSLPRRLKGQVSGDAPRRDVQLFEESINGLRTYLTLIEASRGRRVLAVTSSISREGKTSLAAQLAMSVANSTGKPTLLIDGDMRSPDIHRIFDVEVGPGLAEVLTGRVPLEEAIETEVSSRLHLLTAGRLSASPHQLTGGGEFAATIERLREMYENIIIDTPPILSASEALIMAGAADATIVCVRRDYSRVDQVSESVQRLVASGVKVAGAVLNGVPTQHYAYRYGSYYYTRQRTEEVAADTAEEPRAAG